MASLYTPDRPNPEGSTLPEFLEIAANETIAKGNPDLPYLVDSITEETRYYKDFHSLTRKIASYLFRNDFRKGDTIIWISSYQIHQIPVMCGVWRANGIVRALYVEETEDVILEKAKECKTKWIFCDMDNFDACSRVAVALEEDVKVVVCDKGEEGLDARIPFKSVYELYEDDGSACPELNVSPDDLALILATSGTTGPSKGAMYNHQTLILILDKYSRAPFISPTPFLIANKGVHISGVVILLAMFVKGVGAMVLPKANPTKLLQAIHKYKPGLVYAFFNYLTPLPGLAGEEYDISSVQGLATGGSPMSSGVLKSLFRMPGVRYIVNGYGLTEGLLCASVIKREDADRFEICPLGQPYTGVEIQIRDPHTTEQLAANEKGEVWGRGSIIFQGYYNNPEETKAIMVDGWLRTGDIGWLDEDNNLFVDGRIKDVFKYFHDHVSPTDIEVVINQHPEVEDVCVCPVPDLGGEAARALVVLRDPGKGKDLVEIAKEIKVWAEAKLPRYKHLHGGFYIVDDIPKGKTGKVDRKLASKMPIPEIFLNSN